jgi:hypothetical protein
MIVRIASENTIGLDEDDDFKKFKVVVGRSRNTYDSIRVVFLDAVKFDDPDTAWVIIDTLKAWKNADLDWQAKLDGMIAAARPHGWISADGTAIRAHVQWAE